MSKKAIVPAAPQNIETAEVAESEAQLYARLREILDEGRSRVARSVNSEMVRAYWKIGEAIVEQEQRGKERADYGSQLIEGLAARCKADKLKGFGKNNLYYMRQFYQAFPILHALRGELSWTHYRLLLKVEKPLAREFYEAEAAQHSWSTRELERQVNSLLYERLLMSSEKRAALDKVEASAEKYVAADCVKDPFVLEFLGLKDAPDLTESQLESALIEHLQEFLLELGDGFSFVARQKRISLDGDHFYIDLVFYNRLLKCFVLIDLKMGKLTHQDLGQMQLYVNYYTRDINEDWENPALGILLCADKNETVVRYTLPQGQEQIFASRYALQLPTEAELAAAMSEELRRENARRELEK